jgi:hypothetical protein
MFFQGPGFCPAIEFADGSISPACPEIGKIIASSLRGIFQDYTHLIQDIEPSKDVNIGRKKRLKLRFYSVLQIS